MTARRFTPSAAVARRRNLLVAGLAGVVIAAVAWLDGFGDSLTIAMCGVATTVLTYGAYAVLYRLAGPAIVELEEEALIIAQRGQRIRLPWPEVTHVSVGTMVLDHMLIGRLGSKPVRVSLEGHDHAARMAMQALIQARAGGPDTRRG